MKNSHGSNISPYVTFNPALFLLLSLFLVSGFHAIELAKISYGIGSLFGVQLRFSKKATKNLNKFPG